MLPTRQDILKKSSLTKSDAMNFITDLLLKLFPKEAMLILSKRDAIKAGTAQPTAAEVQPTIALYQIIFTEDLLACIVDDMNVGADEPVPVEFFRNIQTFLRRHWHVIKHAPRLHYQYDPIFSYNIACFDLATLCAKGLKQPCASLLYPDLLEDTCVVTGNAIVDLDKAPQLPPILPTAVLSECGQYFIEIDICFEQAIRNGDGVLRHTQRLITVENKHVMAPLSEKEIGLVTSHNRYAAKLYEAIKEMHRYQFASPTVGASIAALIAGLRDGGANSNSLKFRIGREDNAGLQANESILAFFNFIGSLPDTTRAELYTMRSDKHSFDALMKACLTAIINKSSARNNKTLMRDPQQKRNKQQSGH